MLLLLLSCVPAAPAAAAAPAAREVELVFFYGTGCRCCAGMAEFLQRMQAAHPLIARARR